MPTYDISVRFVTIAERLDIDAQVTIPLATPPADTLTFQLDPRCSDPEVILTDGAVAAAPAFARTGNRLTVTLPPSVIPGKPRVLTFRYSIGSAGVRSFYITADHAFISGEAFTWYPRQTSRRSSGRLRFTLPDGFTVAATGRRQAAGSVTGAPHDFIVTEPTTFSFAAGRHHVVAQPGSPDLALHLLRLRPLVGERLNSLRRILDALVQEFGGYPHSDLEVVELPEAAAGSRESAVSLEGFVVVGPGVMDSFTLPIIAHEVSHQWWSDCVFGVGPNSVLLTEAMAQYGALRATRAIHGDAAAAEFRWRGYPGESLLAGERGYLSLVLAGLDGSLTSPSQAPTLPVTKGMLIHDLLSRSVGEERFRTFLRQFVRAHAFSDVTWRTFIDEATGTFGEQVGVFVRNWCDEKDVPELTLSWTQRDDQLRGTMVQRPAYYSGPIDLALIGANRRSVVSVSLAGERTEFSVDVDFTISSVQVDPDHEIPHRSPERIAGAAVVAPLGRALHLMRTGGADFLSAARDTLSPAPGAPPERQFILEALLADDALERGEHERARTHLRAALAAPSPIREFLPALYYHQAQLAASDNDRELVTRAATAAIEADAMLVAPTGWSLAARELLMMHAR